MIRSYRDKAVEQVAKGVCPKGFPADLVRMSARRLDYLDQARDLVDLRVPPSNHLEAPKGDRKGQHSIRINDQWRICFRWVDGGAEDVEIVDYH
jgi:proteic killer suppression protein